MNRQQDKYCGNILFYDYLARKRAPVVLNRNLNRVLRAHRYQLGRASLQEVERDTQDFRSSWGPLSWDALDEMVNLHRPGAFLVLDVHAIRPMRSSQPAKRPSKTRMTLKTRSELQVAVYSTFSQSPCVSLPAQNADLQGITSHDDRAVSVETKSMVIGWHTLASSHADHDTETIFRMNLFLTLDTQSDAEQIHGLLAPAHAKKQVPSTRLSASWDNILKIPDGKVLLPLQDHTWKVPVEYGIEVTMYWRTAPSDSILSIHNRHLRAQKRCTSQQTPQAILNEPKFRLIFIYAGETLIKDGLECPHCPRRRCTHMADFRMHLAGWHDNFEYQEASREVDDEGRETYTFITKLSDHNTHRIDQRASAKADEPFDVCVIAPRQAFDEQRWLEGDDSYRRKATAKVSKRPGAADVHTTATLGLGELPRRKSPTEVQEIPIRSKKLFMVPEAPPGVTFFRAITKRPLQAGEEISESDDDVDEAWVKSRRIAEYTKDNSLSETTKQFLIAFDTHVWDEHLNSDVHVGDSVIRFVRRKHDWVWQANVFEPFKKKMDELLEDGIISGEVHAKCVEMVTEAQVVQQGDGLRVRHSSHDSLEDDGPASKKNKKSKKSKKGSRSTKAQKGKGRARVTETGHLTPMTAESDGDLEMRDATMRDTTVRSGGAFDATSTMSASNLFGALQVMCGR
ncbi:hypothetical protein ACEQ8H_006294 [Pleosporales sp. CAS-2024a]